MIPRVDNLGHATITNSAIVLGTGVNGIAVIRSLGRLGVRCGAVYSPSRGDYARFSRYLSVAHTVPDNAEDSNLIAAICTVSDRLGNKPPVLVPTTDRYSEFLGRTQDLLINRFFICNPDKSLCDAFLDKWQTAQLCRANNVLIPHTSCPGSLAELEDTVRDLAYPVIVKPRFTFGTSFPGKNAVFAEPIALQDFLSRNSLIGNCIIQQIVPSGDGDILVTASYSSQKATVEAIYSGRKIRQYLPDYGATCFGISERHPMLEQEARQFLDNIGYKGFAALEFARSRTDGRCYFLELNTRTYYHNQLFADAGIDLTQVAYLSATGRNYRTVLGPLKQREGLLWLDFRCDYQSMRIKRRLGRITTLQWLHSIVGARSFACWSWRDPLPFLAATMMRAKELVINIAKRLSVR